MRGSRRAFSLSEILLSTAVFALLLVTAVGVLHWALQASRGQQARTVAAWLAQQQMEQLVDAPTPTAEQGRFPRPHQDYAWESKVQQQSGNDPFLHLKVHVWGPGGASYWLETRRRTQRRAVLFRSADNVLLRTDEELSAAEPLFPEPLESSFSISPDGQTIAYVQTQNGLPQIFTRPLNGSEPGRMLFEHPAGATDPAYSPDGKELAFCANEAGVSQIFLWHFAQRRFENITRSSHQEGSPCWLPDSNGLVVCRDASLLVLLQHGSERVLVESPEGWNASPDVSPDGKSLAFMSTRDGNPEIYTLDLTTRRVRRLTNDTAYDSSPKFSRDGKRIAFTTRNEAGASRLFSMNPDGTSVTPVAPEVSGEAPLWVNY